MHSPGRRHPHGAEIKTVAPPAPRQVGHLAAHSWQALATGLLVAFVGFGSSFAVVLQGLKAVGATDAEAASGLMAVGIAMGLAGIVLSLMTRAPVSCAWSTPGAAMLAGTVAGASGMTFAEAVGGFLVCGVLIVLSGLVRPLGRAVAAIPAPLANAMLAGVLLPLALAPFKAVAFDPLLGLPLLAAFVAASAWRKLLAVPAALAAFVLVVALGVDFPAGSLSRVGDALVPQPLLVAPAFTAEAALSVGLPLFVVTMASQNIPGLAVLNLHGYRPRTGPLLAATGGFSLLAAPFGGHAVNLAAITAAMCAGEDAHPDPTRRYWAGMWGGVFYVLFSLAAGAVVAFVTLAPAVLIEAVAGLALFGAFTAAATAAFERPEVRLAAATTFLATASGMTLGGIAGAFWSLVMGAAVWAATVPKAEG